MTRAGEALPEALENRLFEIHFDTKAEDRADRLAALCDSHPEHAAALRSAAHQLRHSDGLLGDVRSGLEGATEAPAIGAFEIERVLGEGGFGTVYLARQREPVERHVALKVLQDAHVDSRSRQRFEDERQLLARLQHAGIAQIHDAGVTERGLPYFAMEFVDGTPIDAWCKRHDADLDSRLRLFLRVCSAILHAHQREVVHRDIKPSNVLVRVEDGKAQPKVIDFGIGKLLAANAVTDTERTIAGAQLGTPGYMSPEQAAGESVDTRTDVYSLGVLLCLLVAGDLPIARSTLHGVSFSALARVLQTTQPRRPSVIFRENDTPPTRVTPAWLRRLRTDIDWIVLRATAVARDERYDSVAALAADVQRHLDGQPVEARQHASLYVASKFVHRHRLAVTIAATLTLALVSAVAALSWGLGVVDDARDIAERERDVATSRDAAARLAVAQLALNAGDLRGAIDYLASIPSDYRTWEWRHLAARHDGSLRTIDVGRPHLEIAWVDDERFVTFPMLGPIVCRDARTGAELFEFAEWNDVLRRQITDTDRQQTLIAGDKRVSLWDTTTGQRVRNICRVPAEVFALAWSQDRTTAAVAGRGRWLGVLDVTGEAEPRTLRLRGDGTAAAFCGDDQVLVGYQNGEIDRIALADGAVVATLAGHNDVIDALLVDRESDALYSASIDTTVGAWALSTNDLRGKLDGGERMRRLMLSPDRSILYAVGGWAQAPFLAWNTETLQLAGRFLGHESGIGSLALSPQGDRFATVSRDKTVRIWSTAPPQPAITLDAGRDARRLAVSPSGDRFGTASLWGEVRVWDADTLELVVDIETDDGWTGAAMTDETFFAVGPIVRAIRVRDGAVIAEGETGGNRAEELFVDPTNRWLAGGHGDHYLVWRLPELELVHTIELPVGKARTIWDPASASFLVGCRTGELAWVHPERGLLRTEPMLPEKTGIQSMLRHEDRFVVGANRLLELHRGGELHHRREVTCASVAMTPDGSRLATGSHTVVRLWDPATGDELLRFGGILYDAAEVAFVLGGRRLLALDHRWEAPTRIRVWTAPDAVELPR